MVGGERWGGGKRRSLSSEKAPKIKAGRHIVEMTYPPHPKERSVKKLFLESPYGIPLQFLGAID